MKMNPMMKKMISNRMTSIECRKKLYLRKEYKPITLEYIKELILTIMKILTSTFKISKIQ